LRYIPSKDVRLVIFRASSDKGRPGGLKLAHPLV
jgi:hypothetical protein